MQAMTDLVVAKASEVRALCIEAHVVAPDLDAMVADAVTSGQVRSNGLDYSNGRGGRLPHEVQCLYSLHCGSQST